MIDKINKHYNTADVIFIISGIALVLFIAWLIRHRDVQLQKDGRYVMGTIIDEQDFENGYYTKIKYRYKGSTFYYTYNAFPRIFEKHVFMEISDSKPGLCKLLREIKVPPCIDSISAPADGWKEIPSCH